MKDKIIGIVLIALLIALFVVKPIYENISEKMRLDHYDDLYLLYLEQEDMLLDDGILEQSELNESYYQVTGEYIYESELHNIDFQVRQIYREMMMECGIAKNNIKYCTYDDTKGAYKYTAENGSNKLEVYVKNDSEIHYMMSEFKADEYLRLFDGYVDQDGTVLSGIYIDYTASNEIKYYKMNTNKELFNYIHFDIDSLDMFEYRRYNRDVTEMHYTSFTDRSEHVGYTFSRDDSTKEMNKYKIYFFNTNNEYLLSLYYSLESLQSIRWNEDFVDGWSDFYDQHCTSDSIEDEYSGICSSSNDDYIFLNVADHADVSLENLVDLSTFGLSYSDVESSSVLSSNAYFLSNFEEFGEDYGFDIDSMDDLLVILSESIEVDLRVVKKLMR